MIPIKIELCICVLLITNFLVSSRPHQRIKRSLVKDYLNPLTYPTTAVKFEKGGDDGKYHPQAIDSKVEYALAKNIESLNSVAAEDNLKKDEESSKDPSVELAMKATDNPIKDDASEVAETSSFLDETPKLSEFGPTVSDSKPIPDPEITTNSDVVSKSKFSLVKPEDHKLQFQPKPDGKDDQPYELEPILEEYLPQPPLAAEKKDWTGKLAIGQIPFLGRMPFFGSAIPVFLPERSFSLGVFSKGLPPTMDVQDRLPTSLDVNARLPPTVDVQDRLPMTDAEVLEEGSELSVIENVNPVSGVVRGERRTVDHRFRLPVGHHFSFPLSTMRKSLKDIMDGRSHQEQSKAQIVDMMGKKMLLQNKVMKYPTDDSSHMYVGVMSVQPLEEVNIETLKKLGLEKDVKEVDKTNREMEDKRRAEDSPKDKPIIPSFNVDQVPINLSEEEKSSVENKKDSGKDLFEVRESKLNTKNEIEQATGIPTISSKNGQKDVKEVTESKLEGKGEVEGDVVAQATGISKEVARYPEEVILKVKASTEDKKDLESADSFGGKKIIEESKEEKEIKSAEPATKAQDSKDAVNVSLKDNDLIEEKEGKASSGVGNVHESSFSVEDSDEKEDFKKFDDRALEKKDLNVEDIDLTKVDGVLFAESRKKKFSGEDKKDLSKKNNKKIRKECKCEGSTDIDSDSEED